MRSFTAILTIVIVALMVCEAKSQQHYVDRHGTYLTSVPNPYYAANGGMMRGATWAHIVADGGREATAQETADWQAAQDAAALAAAEAAAQAAAEAEAQASLPFQAANGVAVLDDNGYWVLLEPTGDGLPVIGMQVSNIPLTPEEKAEMKAERKAAHEAKRAAVLTEKNEKAKLAGVAAAMFGEVAK